MFNKIWTLNTDKFSSKIKNTNFVIEKGKPWCLPFILIPPYVLQITKTCLRPARRVNIERALFWRASFSKCCSVSSLSNRGNPGAKGWKNPNVTNLRTELPYIFKRNRFYFRSVSLSQKKNIFKVIHPLALRIFFLMVQWVSCGRERSWVMSKDKYSLLKPIRAQERCVPSCHVWLWISQRSVHLNWCWFVHFC